MAETALDDAIYFFEVNPAQIDKHLTQLWAIIADMKTFCSTPNNAAVFKM